MEIKFDETKIPEDVSKDLATKNVIVGSMHVSKLAKMMMVATAKCLGEIKDKDVRKAIIFEAVDGRFLLGAIISYDNTTDTEVGNWTFEWTFNKEIVANNVKPENIIHGTNSKIFSTYLVEAAITLYSIRFESESLTIKAIVTLIDTILHWLEDNAKDGEKETIVLDGVFRASAEVVDGSIQKTIDVDGEIKTLVKGDGIIQEY